jgi:hypothetical protein
LKDGFATFMYGGALMPLTVLREMGQHIRQTHIPKRLKQPGDAVSAFSPTWLADNGEMGHTVWCS